MWFYIERKEEKCTDQRHIDTGTREFVELITCLLVTQIQYVGRMQPAGHNFAHL